MAAILKGLLTNDRPFSISRQRPMGTVESVTGRERGEEKNRDRNKRNIETSNSMIPTGEWTRNETKFRTIRVELFVVQTFFRNEKL